MSLYGTYRPTTFADVVGQDHVVTTLEQAAASGKLAHAYLFAGCRGTGKTSVARILAKIIMTQGITDETLKKQIIRSVENGSIVDLLEIDAASHTGVDDIRVLIEKIQFSPVAASAKVYIIDEVHMLSKSAFNALLKTLEEPPPYAFFILATTELQKIPATIQSRCQCFPFRTIRDEDIIRRLQYIADQEKITVDREAVRAIASHSGGALRDAISLLDQLRSLPKITLDDVLTRIGGTNDEEVESIIQAMDQGDTASIIRIVRRIEEAGTPLDSFLHQLLGTVRKNMHRSIEERLPIDRQLQMLDALLHAIRDVRIAPVPGLILESALLSLSLPVKDQSSAVPVHRKEEKHPIVEKRTVPPEQVEKASSPQEGSSKTEIATIEAPELTMATLEAHWATVVQATTPPSVKMSLKNGHVTSLDASRIVLGFPSAFHRDKVAATEASRKIEEILHGIFKRQLRLECILEGQRTASERGPTEDAVNLAEAAAEIF